MYMEKRYTHHSFRRTFLRSHTQYLIICLSMPLQPCVLCIVAINRCTLLVNTSPFPRCGVVRRDPAVGAPAASGRPEHTTGDRGCPGRRHGLPALSGSQLRTRHPGKSSYYPALLGHRRQTRYMGHVSSLFLKLGPYCKNHFQDPLNFTQGMGPKLQRVDA